MPTPEDMYSEKERELLRLREARTASGNLQRSAPTEFMPTTSVGVPGGQDTPNPPAPNMARMVKDNAAAQAQLRKEAPSVLTDNEKLMAGAAGLGLLAWLAHKALGGGDDNNPPNNKNGPRDRSINREPMMDQSFKGPQEPTLDLTKPLTASPEHAAQSLAGMPEHPNPITELEPSTLSQVGSSNLAAQTKEAIAEQKKVKGGIAPTKEQHTFKSLADIPEGMVFRPDVQNLDRSLANILGPEHRLYAKELINEGKMFGHSADVNKDVSKITTQYFKALQEQVPETILSRDARKAQGIESKFGTYGSVLGKAAKVGGVAGTLMTIAQSANAKEAANALGEAILPIGATPSELQPGTLTAKQLKAFEEAKKLGSPYRSVPPPR